MCAKFAITIARQYGSGGRFIGKKLSEDLGVSFYDKELIQIASQKSGVGEEFFNEGGDKKHWWLLGNLSAVAATIFGYENVNDSLMLNESVFKIQSDIIRGLARKDSAVFVGRAADYVLRMHTRLVSVFICADEADRIERICKYANLNEVQAMKEMERNDKERRRYYNHYTGKLWGHADSYDLCVNSSALGTDKTVELIKDFVKQKIKNED